MYGIIEHNFCHEKNVQIVVKSRTSKWNWFRTWTFGERMSWHVGFDFEILTVMNNVGLYSRREPEKFRFNSKVIWTLLKHYSSWIETSMNPETYNRFTLHCFTVRTGQWQTQNCQHFSVQHLTCFEHWLASETTFCFSCFVLVLIQHFGRTT